MRLVYVDEVEVNGSRLTTQLLQDESERETLLSLMTRGATSETQMPQMPQQDIKVISLMRTAAVKKFYGEMREKKTKRNQQNISTWYHKISIPDLSYLIVKGLLQISFSVSQ